MSAAVGDYALGHSDAEMRRLATQSRLIDPMTRRFLVSAGITPAMRVLDVGSGAGDVALLLADMVGPDGTVIGSDPSLIAVQTSTARVADAGYSNVEIKHGDPAEMTFDQPFDAIVGRYVLQFMKDPASALTKLARHLRPGGIILFHELDWNGIRSSPSVPTYDRACDWIKQTLERSGAQTGLGAKLGVVFETAGFDNPSLQSESVIAFGPAAIGAVRLVTDLIGTLLPAMESTGVATASEVGLSSLPGRIMAEVGADATLFGRAEVGAWVRQPK